MSELAKEQIEELQAGGPGWWGSKSFNTICNIALCFALFAQLGRDGVWDSHGNSGMRYPEESDLSGGATDCAAQKAEKLRAAMKGEKR